MGPFTSRSLAIGEHFYIGRQGTGWNDATEDLQRAEEHYKSIRQSLPGHNSLKAYELLCGLWTERVYDGYKFCKVK